MGHVRGGAIYRVLKTKKPDYKIRLKTLAKWILILIISASILFGLVWKTIDLYQASLTLSPDKQIESQLKIFETFAQLISGSVILLGLYFTWRNLVATNKNIEIAQESQINERFTKAIENLGHQKAEVRIGGIYALERMARDAKTHADYWTIIEVLMAYIRENAHWSEAKTKDSTAKLATDIQAILTVIGRRKFSYASGEEQFIDLHATDLRHAYLFGANLEHILLVDAHLEGADLVEANLKGAILRNAHLAGADLRGAHFEDADFTGANLEGALLNGAYLQNAHLGRAVLKNADLRVAHLESAYLAETELDGANLKGTYFRTDKPVERKYEVAIGHIRHKGKALTSLEATGLTLSQLQSAINFEEALLPEYLKLSDESLNKAE